MIPANALHPRMSHTLVIGQVREVRIQASRTSGMNTAPEVAGTPIVGLWAQGHWAWPICRRGGVCIAHALLDLWCIQTVTLGLRHAFALTFCILPVFGLPHVLYGLTLGGIWTGPLGLGPLGLGPFIAMEALALHMSQSGLCCMRSLLLDCVLSWPAFALTISIQFGSRIAHCAIRPAPWVLGGPRPR